ncbi:hypothetical protein [Plantactinospora sp. CA-290183]|uniref:hypothetical protein n=1 Tax=Plantactinospora sp. CA-290183 TaxID=3240006 RepID=UPI003D94D860
MMRPIPANEMDSVSHDGRMALRPPIKSRRRIPMAILAVVVAIAGTSVITTAVIYWPNGSPTEHSLPPSTEAPPIPGQIGISVSPKPTGGSYEPVSRPCTAVGWGPIATHVGRPDNDPQEKRTASGAIVTMTCSTALGEGDSRGVAMAEITLIKDGSAEDMFQWLRRTVPEDTVVSPVSGLGTAAYAYVEEDLGPVLVTYDGNAYIRLVWAPSQQQTLPMYGDIARALIDVAQQTLDYLLA